MEIVTYKFKYLVLFTFCLRIGIRLDEIFFYLFFLDTMLIRFIQVNVIRRITYFTYHHQNLTLSFNNCCTDNLNNKQIVCDYEYPLPDPDTLPITGYKVLSFF